MRPILSLVAALLLAALLAGCRQSAGGTPIPTQPAPDATAEVTPDGAAETESLTVTIALTDEVMLVGVAPVTVTVTDADGEPVTGATVALRADMTHAGMAPVLASAEETGDGVYVAQVDWNMGGDWVLTITATAPDGRTGSATLETRVES